MEDGSRAGWIFVYIGGFLNLIAMAALIVRIVQYAMDAMDSPEEPNKMFYFLLITLMLYIGVLGVWMFEAGQKMKYSYSLHKGAVLGVILGVLSLNPFTIGGGIFGIVDSRDQEKIKALAIKNNSENLGVKRMQVNFKS
jgi:hypothetical protein